MVRAPTLLEKTTCEFGVRNTPSIT